MPGEAVAFRQVSRASGMIRVKRGPVFSKKDHARSINESIMAIPFDAMISEANLMRSDCERIDRA